MGLFSKSKPDASYSASQQQANDLMVKMAKGTPLPAMPKLTPAQQGMGGMPAINANPTGLPAYLGGGQSITYPEGLPNQLSMIANQLSTGGYGAPQDIQAQLSGLYSPMTVAPQLPVAPVPVLAAAAKKPVVKKVVAKPKPPAVKVAPKVPLKPPVKKPMGFTGSKLSTGAGGGGRTERTSGAGYGYGYR